MKTEISQWGHVFHWSSDWRMCGRNLRCREVVIPFMISAWGNRYSPKLFCTCRSCDFSRVECYCSSGVLLNFFNCVTWENLKQNKTRNLVAENPMNASLVLDSVIICYCCLKIYSLVQIRILKFYFFYWRFSLYPKLPSST